MRWMHQVACESEQAGIFKKTGPLSNDRLAAFFVVLGGRIPFCALKMKKVGNKQLAVKKKGLPLRRFLRDDNIMSNLLIKTN